MNERRTCEITTDDDQSRAPRSRDILRFAPVVPLTTAGGCCVVAVCLWPVLPQAFLPAWLVASLAIAVAQWQSLRWFGAGAAPLQGETIRRRWILPSALASGLFWGASSVALFPADSIAHQLLLAFILVAITALWLPLFALTRLAFVVFAVPGLLPMAFALLTSPEPPQTTMGSLLLLLAIVYGAVAHTTRRLFFADMAARRELYVQATQDSLVGLANRAEFHRHARTLEIMSDQPYAMVFIDLDHFKSVNDTAGHAAGDELLRHVGAVLKDAVRKGDLAARLGGDEFAILMQDCSAAEAAQIAAQVLERIRGLALTCGTRRRRMSASIGVACSADLCTSPAKLLEAADQACYAAKRGGRNRIEIATSLSDAAARPPSASHFTLVTDAWA
jgi:diguanylate cyclase (GGDEF)-like protein